MVAATITQLGTEPTAHPQWRQCGHDRHVGPCPACQRAARVRSQAQLAAAVAARESWATQALSARAA